MRMPVLQRSGHHLRSTIDCFQDAFITLTIFISTIIKEQEVTIMNGSIIIYEPGIGDSPGFSDPYPYLHLSYLQNAFKWLTMLPPESFIHASTRSPSFIGPTPFGVPVHTKSPGSRSYHRVRCSMIESRGVNHHFGRGQLLGLAIKTGRFPLHQRPNRSKFLGPLIL